MKRLNTAGRAVGCTILITCCVAPLTGALDAEADGGGVHHPACATVVDQPHTVDTAIAGTVYIKAGPNHYAAGDHSAGWDVPGTWNGKDTSHYDICPTTTPPTTTEPPVTTTEPPVTTTEPPVTTAPPTTTEPPVTTAPPTTTEPPVTTAPPTTAPTTTEPATTTTAPLSTDPPPGVATTRVYGECGLAVVTFLNHSAAPVRFALSANGAVTEQVVPAGTFDVHRFDLPEDSGSVTYEAWIVDVPAYPRKSVTVESDCLSNAPGGVVVIPPLTDVATPPTPAPPASLAELPQTGPGERAQYLAAGGALALLGGLGLVRLARRREL